MAQKLMLDAQVVEPILPVETNASAGNWIFLIEYL